MAPDLDVLIRSTEDPLLFLEFHRQFSHALIFIPIGGFLCASLLHLLYAHRFLTFLQSLLYCTMGYATHGLLDSCTSYGTQLFWPFSTTRIAWNNVSIIDPLFTLPLLLGVVLAILSQRRWWACLALAWALAYLSFGLVQHQRALKVAQSIADSRAHVPSELTVKPSFANLLLWKSIYESDGYYYIDAVRIAINGTVFDGQRVQKLDVDRDYPWLDRDSQQARDIERFRWFSAGFLARSGSDPNLIIDMRYSAVPNEVSGLWGIVLAQNAGADDHVVYRSMREFDRASRERLLDMLFNRR